MKFKWLVLLLLAFWINDSVSVPSWYGKRHRLPTSVLLETDSVPASQTNETNSGITMTTISRQTANGQRLTGYVATFDNPAQYFSILTASGSYFQNNSYTCTTEKTSETSADNDCTYAVNGGFFNMETRQCLGNLIHDGQTLQLDNNSYANFGLDKKSNFVAGYMSEDDIQNIGFKELITGHGWLVRSGQNYIQESIVAENLDSHFVNIKAPRTGLAFDKLGRLLLLQIDGEEDIHLGPDLYEFTDVFMSLNVWSAVNIDGGGSSVSVYKSRVISKPTCDDTPRICERAVTSIVCVK